MAHHCRACRELVAAGSEGERYVCGRTVWIDPIKPLSVANGRRVRRMGAACPHVAASSGRWLPCS